MQKTGIQSIDKFFNYGQNNQNLQRQPFTSLIHTVIQMFESEYTQNLHDRKAKSIINFCKQRSNGFYYQQIEPLTKIFQFVKEDLFNGIYQMIPAIQTILNVDSNDKISMFNKNASSDELRYLKVLPPYLNSLIPFLKYDEHIQINDQMEELRQSIIVYIRRFAQRQIPQIIKKQQSFQNQKSMIQQVSPIQTLRIQGTKHLRSIAQSQIVQALVRLLNDYDNQPDIIYPLMETFSFLAMYSRLSYDLCEKGVLPLTLQIMLLCQDFRNNLVKTAFEIVWSSIQCVGVECLSVLAKQQYVYSLKDLFLRVIQQGYKLDDKCLRNQILILVNYLLSLPQAIDLFLVRKQIEGKLQPCFLQVLFQYANIDQNRFYQTKTRVADRKVQFGTNAQDLQLKKLFWSGLLTAIQSNNDKVIQIAVRNDFIKYLLVYIDTANNCYAVSRWSPPQLRQLQKSALSILANVILYMKDDFEDKKGIFCLTKFLSNVTDIERRQKCLKAFSNASLFDQAYKLRISQEGVFDYLIEFLQGEDNPVQIKQECFTIIANLCQGCKKNKKLFREKNGVDIVIGYLKDQNIATSNRYALLGLSLLNCLWNAILGSRRSQQIFLNSQGMFDLLQFIEVCEYSHRKMSLSCLSYLIENAKAINEFLDWNSEKTMINATQLMIKIYQQEDQRFGVRYQQGVIKNKNRPLIPHYKKTTSNINPGDNNLKDFTEAGTQTYLVNRIKQEVEQYDLRLIVFSILYRIGWNKNDLNANQQQKIEVIQLYPHFKMGQIWGQIRNQLKHQNIEPTQDDKHWMQTSIEQFQEQLTNCVNTQSLIMKQFHKTQEGDLSKFYQIIKTNKQLK